MIYEDIITYLSNNFNLIIMCILMIIIPLIILKIFEIFFMRLSDNNTLNKDSINLFLRIMRYLTFAIIGLGLLDIFGVNIHSLFVSLGLLTVALSLAAKDTLSNIISGLMILIEKNFVVGDVIEIDGQKGQVIRIGLKSVTLYYKHKYIMIPNVLFTTKSLVNCTRDEVYGLTFNVFVLNEYDLNEKIDEISKVLDKSDLILKEPKYTVHSKNITTHGVELLIKVYIEDSLKDTKVVNELINSIKKEVVLGDAI